MLQTSHHHIHVAEGIVSYFRNVYPYPEIMRNLFSEEALEDANWIITKVNDGSNDKILTNPNIQMEPIRFQRIYRYTLCSL